MDEEKIITPEEQERRRKISESMKAYIKEKRRKGYEAWLEKKHKEMAEREKKEKKRKEKERERKKAEKEKQKHKRKPGRPKKRGPKKKRKYVSRKPKIDGRTCSKYKRTIDFKIISCHNGKQDRFIEKFRTSEEAYKYMEGLMAMSNEVVFPIESQWKEKTADTNPKYTYYILEKNRFGDKGAPLLKNDIGKYVPHETTNEKWVILDKFPYKIEETFWVWGYNPRTDRKTWPWIWENLVLPKADDRYAVVRVMLYKNKVIIRDDDTMEIVFCKTTSDAIKFYNLLQNKAMENKIKQIFFLGSYNTIGDRRRKLEQEIMDLTGWTKEKVQSSNTRKK